MTEYFSISLIMNNLRLMKNYKMENLKKIRASNKWNKINFRIILFE
jgi:hypothetical protein